MERSTRTVFAYNLNLRGSEFDVLEFFSKAGAPAGVGMGGWRGVGVGGERACMLW